MAQRNCCVPPLCMSPKRWAWKAKDAKRFKGLERENATLKRLLAGYAPDSR
jgi:hypothetical protein